MKHSIITFVIIAVASLGAFSKTWKASDLEQPRKYDARNSVSNPDGILSPQTVTEINALINDIEEKTHAQVGVAVIDDFEGGDIDYFATDLFEEWGVGEKNANNGVLLIVAVEPRRYAFRTGRGIGSELTDVQTARIGREILVPNFRAGDYDTGVLEAVRAIHSQLTSPEAQAELLENSARAHERDEEDIWDILLFYLWGCIALTVIVALWATYSVYKTRNEERHRRYMSLRPMMRILYGLGFIGLGLPFLVYLPVRLFVKNLREGDHLCPNCGTKMHRLDEEQDNLHLTPAQDAEERFNSVDYDVWECPSCGEEDIYAFENSDSDLVECPSCHAKTARRVRDRVVKMPTTTSEGIAVTEYDCLNCRKRSQKAYKLPKNVNAAGVAAAAAIPFILGGRGGGGGGFGGGSFGGGLTGGGGSSGGW